MRGMTVWSPRGLIQLTLPPLKDNGVQSMHIGSFRPVAKCQVQGDEEAPGWGPLSLVLALVMSIARSLAPSICGENR